MLPTQFTLMLPVVFGFAAVLYLWLAVRVSRATQPQSNNAISYFLFLIGAMIAGSAFAFGTDDSNIYGIGRTLSFSPAASCRWSSIASIASTPSGARIR